MNNLHAVLRIELIGDDFFYAQRHGLFERDFHRWLRYAKRLGPDKSPSWVAKLTRFADGDFERVFLEPMRDYTDANSMGSRGVYAYYPLEPGIYEVNERVKWNRVDHYFLRVEYGKMTRINQWEAIECMRKSD